MNKVFIVRSNSLIEVAGYYSTCLRLGIIHYSLSLPNPVNTP